MIAQRYSDLSYIMSLDWEYGMDLLYHCADKGQDKELWQVYLADRANSNVKPKPFSEYKKMQQKEKLKKQSKYARESTEDTIARIERHRKKWGEKNGTV